MAAAEKQDKPGAVGWEKNAQGKMAPRMADLAPMMDPVRYVLTILSSTLALKLMFFWKAR
jgi:ubiquitin-like modifier-activating enzyme ATG7